MVTAAPQTLSDLAQKAIAHYLHQAIAYEQPVLADTDPENLHQMRVGLRRLRTAIQVFSVGVELPKAGREPRVAAVGRRLGQLRDLDVIEATLRDRYAPHLPEAEQRLLDTVLSHLDRQRQRTYKQIKKLLDGKRYTEMKQSLAAWVSAPAEKPVAQLPAAMVVPDLVLPLVSQLWLHPAWLIGIKPGTQGGKISTRLGHAAIDGLLAEHETCLHDLRKQVKRVRYQLSLVASLYGDALEADIQRLSKLQTVLGDLQDSAVLGQFITDWRPEAEAQMPTLFGQLATSRRRAWKPWQTHQQYYLKAEHRQGLRLILAQPAGSEPAAIPVAQAAKTSSSASRSKTAAKRTAKPASTQLQPAPKSRGTQASLPPDSLDQAG
ncbi:MAG: CHAD domain-containing protein [Nodosilinea sp.]